MQGLSTTAHFRRAQGDLRRGKGEYRAHSQSDGYPQKYESGFEITMPADKNIYVAGAKLSDGKLLTAGGRVLGVTETADTLENAIAKAYETVKTVNFANAYYRKDIGKKALEV